MTRHLTTLLLLLAASCWLSGQALTIYPEAGAAFGPAGRASGYALGLNFQLRLSPRQAIGIELGHLFTNSRGALPKDFERNPYYISTANNPRPLSLGGTASSGNPLGLGARPSRYFTFNMGLKHLFTVMERGRHTVYVAGGLALAYRDEMEVVLVASLDGKDATILAPPLLQRDPIELPVYRYASYWDVGLLGEAGYRYALGDRLFLHTNTKLIYYASSNGWMLAVVAGVGVRI